MDRHVQETASDASGGRNVHRLTVVLPTLNVAGSIDRAIETLEGGPVAEIVVSDGGSFDGTAAIARAMGARVCAGPPGRGGQLAAGAALATGDWLLFLHADTRLGPGWRDRVSSFMRDPANVERAAVFRLRFDDRAPAARRLERIVAWRVRVFGLPYGDQGLLLSRALYDGIGGFRPLPIMEDVDIVRRIGRKRLTVLDCDAITSATRYRRHGYLMRPLRNLFCLALFFLGVPARWIVRVYG